MKLALAPLLILAACSAQPPTVATTGGIKLRPIQTDAQVPDYAKRPYEPFSRENAVAVALREWRAWGMRVNDAPPGPDLPIALRPDREPGLWQRVGDYWWFGQNALSPSGGWTGKYGDFGAPYRGEPAAWSAAFISYLMRVAGAGDRFPYSTLHATYINAAAQGNSILQALPPESTAPGPGDLICYGRRGAERLRFSDLPAPSFYGHCDMVVAAEAGLLTVIGGNVTAGVTMKHVPVTASGTLAGPGGIPVDQRYPWFVVLRVLYDDGTLNPLTVQLPGAIVPASAPPIVLVPAEEAVPVPVLKPPPPRSKPTVRPKPVPKKPVPKQTPKRRRR